MPNIQSANYAPSASPVSGECQTNYNIGHFSRKIEKRLAANNSLLSTTYSVYKIITRVVQCVDPLKRDPIHFLHCEPETLVSSETGTDASGRSIVTKTFLTRMNASTELRCSPCVGPEVSAGAYKAYRLNYDSTDTSAQDAAKLEYDKQDRFHRFYVWTPQTEPTYNTPAGRLLERIVSDYGVQWGSDVNTTLSTTSFFSPCSTETTSTGCTS